MTEADAFFTHAIVGAPVTCILGRRLTRERADALGLQVNMQTGETRLSQVWRDWVVLSHATDAVGQPRLRPGRVRAMLERHALVIAGLGLVGLATSAVCAGLLFWK
jgi:hypothetical protein